jgi:DNA-binding IclR family transcriptional regulator
MALAIRSRVAGTLRVEEALRRLKGAFLEMPGTQLSLSDAARLTGLEHDTCRDILSALEDVRFLRQRHNGVFVQRTSESPDS